MAQGFYRIHVADKLIPSITYSVNNILVIFKATICQIVLPQLSPNLFHRIELWGYRRKKQQADIVKLGQLFCGVPSSSIHYDHSMPARCQAVLDASSAQPWLQCRILASQQQTIGLWQDR